MQNQSPPPWRPAHNFVWDGVSEWVPEEQSGGASGGDGAIVDGVSSSIKATVKDYANSNPLTVSIVDTNGDAASIGGGTQYTEDAAAPANPVGTALILVREDARAGSLTTADNDNVAARGNNKGEQYVKHTDPIEVFTEEQLDYDTGAGTVAVSLIGLALPASGGPVAGGTTTNPVQIGDAGGSLTVDGSVTANAGTNLNTSALALEAGGNLAAAAASLSVLDDWDESDRAKVNVIVGQAGIAAGTGTDGATVPRVTLATNVALPAGANAIGKLAANSGVDIGDVDVTSIAAGDNNIGNVDIVTVPADPFGANGDAASATGSISAKLRFIAGTGIPITGTVTVGSHAVTNAGTFAVQATAVGTIADDATTPGAPVMVGGTAINPDGTDPGSVSAENDVTRLITDRNRRLFVNLVHPRALHAHLDGSGAYTDQALIADPGDNFQVVITNIIGSTGAGTAQTVINLATDIAAGNFSGAPAATFSNNDAAIPNATHANAMAEFPDWAAAPVAGTVVELWGLLKDVDSTDDDTGAPATTAPGGARFFGAFVIEAADALQRRTIVISLEGINNFITVDFYLKNGTAQNMNNDAGTNCVVKITPFSYGITV